jgi:hypothetical protein
MAPTLTSNSFLPNTTPHSRLSPKNPRLTVFAKQAGPFSPFQFGKPKDDASSSEGSQTDGSGNSSPFNFNFGKIPGVKSLVPVVSKPASGLSFGNSRRKDPGTVFVAGATGQAGIRIAQTLLREGFSVRAGVPELGAAQELARLAAQYKVSYFAQLENIGSISILYLSNTSSSYLFIPILRGAYLVDQVHRDIQERTFCLMWSNYHEIHCWTQPVERKAS